MFQYFSTPCHPAKWNTSGEAIGLDSEIETPLWTFHQFGSLPVSRRFGISSDMIYQNPARRERGHHFDPAHGVSGLVFLVSLVRGPACHNQAGPKKELFLEESAHTESC